MIVRDFHSSNYHGCWVKEIPKSHSFYQYSLVCICAKDFLILTLVIMNFYDVTPHGLVGGYQRFEDCTASIFKVK
jgi:hypothetical protein